MNQTDKIQLIKKHLGNDTDQWTVVNCLRLLKAYDKEKKDHRIKLLTKLKPNEILK